MTNYIYCLFGILAVISNLFCFDIHAKIRKRVKKTPIVHTPNERKNVIGQVITNAKNDIIHEGWYTMLAGSIPWGYFHEIIEERSDGMGDSNISYRYEMVRIEHGVTYQEILGALSKRDLTPITFNLVKTMNGVNEVVNGSLLRRRGLNNQISVTVTGTKNSSYKKAIKKNTIFESFFSLWLARNVLKEGAKTKGYLSIFTEDGSASEFAAKTARYEVLGEDSANKCTTIRVKLMSDTSTWCVGKIGNLVSMKLKEITIQQVASETEAKKFLSAKTE
ncbi:MAG: hypothetical protein AB7F43_14285 [Bacteriovoracia bacterium]